MYGGYDDAGPGPSRRAWSPAYPATTRRSADFDAGYRGGGGGGGGTGGWSRRREREPSDVSVEVEALDLADYGRSMNHGGYDAGVPGALPMRYEHDYPPPRPFSANPFASPPTSPDHTQRLSPSYTGHHSPSPPGRPFSTQTRDSFAPSLVSGPTAPTSHSSHSHDNYYYSQFNYPRRTSAPPPAHANSDPGAAQAYGFGRRGAPPAAHVQHTGIFAPGGPQNRSSGSLPRVNTPKSPDNDIDVRNFPRFSRGWYDNNNGTKSNLRDVGGPPILFPDFNGAPMHTVKPAPYVSPPSYASGSQREFLPWGAAPDEGESVPDIIKEERMRMLEREFGSRPPRAPAEKEEEPEERIVGSVDSRGNLITPGPRKRLWVRITEACFSFGAGVAGIYAAFVIKPNPPAPPSGTIPPIVLDVLGVLTFLILMYVLVIRRCCVRNKPPKEGGLGMPGMPGGLMVLPVPQGGKKKNKKPKKGHPQGPGDIQVNLIVDPSSFMPQQQPQRSSRRRGQYSELSGDMDDEDDTPAPPRRSVFHGLALEHQWRVARKYAKRLLAVDIVLALAWGGVFGWAAFAGENCPPGKFDGWCDAYNISLAGACLLVILFLCSAFFGIRDLRASAQSPRTRTRV